MNKAVVQFIDGREKKGMIPFFNLAKQTFPFETKSDDGKMNVLLTVHIEEVRKINFLKTDKEFSAVKKETIAQTQFAGNIAYKLVVEMNDGEVLTGTTLRYSPGEKSFFVMPLNPADRSERIYINARCVVKVDQKRLLGKMLVDSKLIDGKQLQNALDIQAESRNKMIGQILVEQDLISRQQLDESLNKQQSTRALLGEILVEAQYITRGQLERALFVQGEQRKKRLGQILVDLKYVTANDICLAVASQLGCNWIDLAAYQIPAEVLGLLPHNLVTKYEVLPVELRYGELLVVASAQPRDEDMRKEVSAWTALRTEFVVAFDGYILPLIKKHYTLPDGKNPLSS
ncbi:MAG: hypothetical protein JW843_02800 [Candidatus Aminicenantes bacterium]|nr:hypothetical protein [Candidatus Aminicenantes bacterium]